MAVNVKGGKLYCVGVKNVLVVVVLVSDLFLGVRLKSDTKSYMPKSSYPSFLKH